MSDSEQALKVIIFLVLDNQIFMLLAQKLAYILPNAFPMLTTALKIALRNFQKIVCTPSSTSVVWPWAWLQPGSSAFCVA
ncbi:MAG: hypothetical protein IPO07_04395 [Haliscomenobacter sp.]|nr:hypothetical protein [Haliscomenobacter sp.]MBK9488108.1 hypothetical protein [Haliscomenobacter sp.]